MSADVEAVFRREHGRAAAVLVRLVGDIGTAEEMVQDAFVTALQRWPVDGVPPSPAGWIITTARHRALDRLVDSRRAARTGPGGDLVLLEDQDRGRWDSALVAEGQDLVRRCLRCYRPGPYQLQAAVQAVHSDAASAAGTDWRQVLALYDHLLSLAPSPVVALHRAVALAEVGGPATALPLVDALPGLQQHHTFHAVRADLLRRLGRPSGRRRAGEPLTGCRQATPTAQPVSVSRCRAAAEAAVLPLRGEQVG